MPETAPQVFVIAGPNGSGKTTSAKKLLPTVLECNEYINADSVAAALSPFRPEEVAIQAGRLMLDRIKHLANQGVSFAFETTLASRTFIRFLNECKIKGYETNIVFFWLSSPQLAIQRVQYRVEQGGHNIPKNDIVRRYHRSIRNFMVEYSKIVHNWVLYDNCKNESTLIAQKTANNEIILDTVLWQTIQKGLINEDY